MDVASELIWMLTYSKKAQRALKVNTLLPRYEVRIVMTATGHCFAYQPFRNNKKGADPRPAPFSDLLGAGNRVRTGDLNLGKVALYQLSYSRNVSGRR